MINMTLQRGRSSNTNDEATVTTFTINDVTPIIISTANPDRIHLSVSLDSGKTDNEVFVRLYPSSDDSDKKGDVLARITTSNDVVYNSPWRMEPDNIYTGEVSAIAETGTVIVHVTEY